MPRPPAGRVNGAQATAPALPASRRTALPRPALLLVWASALVGLAVVAAFLPGLVDEVRLHDWSVLWPALLFTAALVMLAQFAVNVPIRNHRFSMNVADMVIVLGVVFVRTPLLILATAVGIAISQCLLQPQLVKRLFNVSQHVLSVAAAAAVISALITLIRQRQPFGVVVEEAS